MHVCKHAGICSIGMRLYPSSVKFPTCYTDSSLYVCPLYNLPFLPVVLFVFAFVLILLEAKGSEIKRWKTKDILFRAVF